LTHQKVCPPLITSSSSADNPVVRSRLRRFNDDDHHWWNVSPSPNVLPVHKLISRSSTAAMGKGVTESQFVDDKAKKALENL
jgi:hypothetical protein